jgi:hypothetical protein
MECAAWHTSRSCRQNQEVVMQIAGIAMKCGKATVARIAAGLAISGLALPAWPSDADGRDAASEDRVAATPITPPASANETSPENEARARANDAIDGDAQVFAAPGHANLRLEDRAQTFELAGTDIGVIHPRNNTGLQTIATPGALGSPRADEVTLWDEIVPPTPAPPPVGAAQPAPGSVAGAAAK